MFQVDPGENQAAMLRPSANRTAMSDNLQRVALTQDPAAFQALYESFAPRIKSYMLRQGADAATAEELAQETLLAVWRKAKLYSPDKGNATTWIFTIARNLRIDRIRKERVWLALPEGHDEQASEDDDPEEVAVQRQHTNRIQEALATLSEEQRDVIVLSYIDGLSHSEIAEKLDLPLGTVKSRMRLAYQKIRESVEDLR
jgi:RNA polymerase sigma-70 factor, ECF subfamily